MSLNINKYKFEGKVLGKGAFATVHLATNIETGQKVALKEMPKEIFQDKGTKDDIDNEIKISETLKNTNIVAILERVEAGDKVYIAYEFCNGGDLRKYMNYFRKFNDSIIQRIMIQLINGLKQLYDKKVIHHDIKPENVLIQIFYKEKDEKIIEEKLNKIKKLMDKKNKIVLTNIQNKVYNYE